MSRVVVVGGGFGGTATAARLAKLGHSVTVVERRDRLGGAVGLVERDGFRWDAGPAATALPAVLRDLFRKSGRPLDRELELVPLDPLREHRFPDGTRLALPSGGRAGQLEAVEAAWGGGLGRAWVDYVHGFAATWDLLRRSYLERPWSREHADPGAVATLRSRASLQREVTRALPDERLRQLALLPARLDGQDPRRTPAWAGMWVYVEQTFGLWTVPGGLGTLAAAMDKRLAERRVDVLLETTVRDLRLRAGRVVGVDTDAGPLDAQEVVCAVDPASLPALARHARRCAPAPPPSVSHLGLVGDVPRLPAEVVLHGDPLLVVRTGGRAPDGAVAWTVLARGATDEDVVTTLARRGIDVRGRVEVRVDRSPLDQTRALTGSPYGVRWRGRGTLDRKLASPPYDGLHLAGAHAAAGAGLPLVGLSAAVVAARIGPA
jgi:phytoene dehydrogenase-like protein